MVYPPRTTEILSRLDVVLASVGFRDTGAAAVGNWRFTDTSQGSANSCGAFSQTIKMTESARHALLDAIRKDVVFRKLQLEWDVDFESCSRTGKPVTLVKCLDARLDARVTNDPIQPDMVRRMADGQRYAY